MKGKKRDGEEIQDGLVVEEVMMVNFTLVPFSSCLLSLQLLLLGFSCKGEVKQAHCRYAKGPYIMHHRLENF